MASTAASNIDSNTGSRPKRVSLMSLRIYQFVLAIAIVSTWEWASRRYALEFWISSPSGIFDALIKWARSGNLSGDLRVTLMEAALGFVIGSVVGGLVGFVLGWVRRLGDLLEPFVLSIYTIPKIALAPLFVLWFGIGPGNKVMLAAVSVVFYVFFTTFQGAREVDRDLIENAKIMGAKNWSLWTKVAIPYSAVWMFTGVRIALPHALTGAIVGEFIAADSGVGFRIKEASFFFNTDAVFAGLFILMVISLLLLAFLKLTERWALRWQSAKGEIQQDLAL